MEKLGMHEEVPDEGCWVETGKPPIGTRCMGVIKKSDGETLMRSRLAARGLRDKGDKMGTCSQHFHPWMPSN